jgi:hypothetical protein
MREVERALRVATFIMILSGAVGHLAEIGGDFELQQPS